MEQLELWPEWFGPNGPAAINPYSSAADIFIAAHKSAERKFYDSFTPRKEVMSHAEEEGREEEAEVEAEDR